MIQQLVSAHIAYSMNILVHLPHQIPSKFLCALSIIDVYRFCNIYGNILFFITLSSRGNPLFTVKMLCLKQAYVIEYISTAFQWTVLVEFLKFVQPYSIDLFLHGTTIKKLYKVWTAFPKQFVVNNFSTLEC